MYVLSTRDPEWMRQCEAALLAESINARWVAPKDGHAMLLDVPASEGERAASVLSEQLGEELRHWQNTGLPLDDTPLLLRPAVALGLGLAALTLVFFFAIGGSQGASVWYLRGALFAEYVYDGQWWRVVTAATLHADVRHAVANAAFFLVLGWAAGERLGVGAALFCWLVTAVLGFSASLFLTDVQLTVGASGGLYGLLGAAAGHGVRTVPAASIRPRRTLRVVGAAVLFVAYTAFGQRSNIAAHLGGFVAGMGVGLVVPRRQPRMLVQSLLAAMTAAILLAAWAVASRS